MGERVGEAIGVQPPRGERRTDRLENIFSGLNTELPAIQQDLRGLADFSETYADAAPELISALDNLRTTGNTVVEKQSALATLYT
ncbi:MCE family protein, partial [Acetobacter fabarum]|uniref:MCE family protein n=1 Tax=Acetobacter fabarum TaxID=483199 RepID=UPI00383B5868